MTGSAFLVTISSLGSSQAVSSCSEISTVQPVIFEPPCVSVRTEALPGRKVAELGSNSTLVTAGVMAWNKTTGPPGIDFGVIQ